MTSLQDCLEEVIGKGSDYVIRTSNPTGTQRTVDWQPAALLAHLQRTSLGVLGDRAWTEWHLQRTSGTVGYIHYGAFGSSLGHMEVPGYGRLSVLEHTEVSPDHLMDAVFGMPHSDGY